MKRILVTGAGGFIGARLVHALTSEGHETHAALRPGGDSWRLRGVADVRRHEVPLTDPAAVFSLLNDVRPEWIFHTAAHGAYADQRDPRRIVEDTVLASAVILDAAARTGVETFIHTGSSSEYGFADHAPAEDELPRPNSLYAVGKLAATLYGQHVAASTGMKVVTARLYSVYGPLEAPERLIPTLLVRASRGMLPPLANPETSRDFVYVDDVVQALLVMARDSAVSAGSVFNVGTGRQVALGEVVALAREIFGVTESPAWCSFPDRSWDSATWQANPDRLLRAGWRPATTLADGLARTMTWLHSDDAMRAFYEARVDAAMRMAVPR